MRLWEKNYVLTMTLILLILYGSIFYVFYDSFQINFNRACERGIQTEQGILYFVKSLLNEDPEHKKLNIYCETMKKQNVYVAVYEGRAEIVDYIPALNRPETKQGLQVVTDGKSRYLYISDSFLSRSGKELCFYYVEQIDEIYENYRKQVYVFLLINAFISFFIAGVLYFAMKKIYYPINNIAHELRTPLTSIQGYAQYILFGKVSGEDIQYASSRINEEAGYINEIIERLLVMENIKNGKIDMEKIELDDLFDTVKVHYPDVIIHNNMKYVMGDKTLITCLFMNLLSNISRAEGQIVITAFDNEINICNRGDFIDKSMLKVLNGNRSIPKDQIKGKGLGVSLCHEIVKLHHGSLHYESQEKEGVKVTISIPVLTADVNGTVN